MTSPLLRLFAVFWWLLVAGSAAVAICGLLIVWDSYHSSQEYTAYRAALTAGNPSSTPEEAAAVRLEAIRAAVDSWEASIRTRDPDYAQMSDAVRSNAQRLLQERGIPRTPQEGVALVQAAYEAVKHERGELPYLELDDIPAPDTDQPLPRAAAPAVPIPPDRTMYVLGATAVFLVSLLPFAIMTVIRWIITSRWRFGPHW